MANVLNRTTKQFIPSANTVEYPVEDWIINPDMSAVVGQPSKYWTISGDTVSLMSQGERDAVDAALIASARDALAAEMDQVESYARAFALVVLDEINAHATNISGDRLAAVNGGTYAAFRTAATAVSSTPTRTIAQLKTALRNKLGT